MNRIASKSRRAPDRADAHPMEEMQLSHCKVDKVHYAAADKADVQRLFANSWSKACFKGHCAVVQRDCRFRDQRLEILGERHLHRALCRAAHGQSDPTLRPVEREILESRRRPIAHIRNVLIAVRFAILARLRKVRMRFEALLRILPVHSAGLVVLRPQVARDPLDALPR